MNKRGSRYMAQPVGRTAPSAGCGRCLRAKRPRYGPIARILKSLTRDVRGAAFIEVDRQSD